MPLVSRITKGWGLCYDHLSRSLNSVGLCCLSVSKRHVRQGFCHLYSYHLRLYCCLQLLRGPGDSLNRWTRFELKIHTATLDADPRISTPVPSLLRYSANTRSVPHSPESQFGTLARARRTRRLWNPLLTCPLQLLDYSLGHGTFTEQLSLPAI